MINECECSRQKVLQNSVRKSSVLVNLPRISAPLDWTPPPLVKVPNYRGAPIIWHFNQLIIHILFICI